MIKMTDKTDNLKMVAESQICALSHNASDGLTYYKSAQEYVLGTDVHSSLEQLNRTITVLAEYADACQIPYIRIDDYAFFHKFMLAEIKLFPSKYSIGFMSKKGKFLAYITLEDKKGYEDFCQYIMKNLAELPEEISISL
ncbi:hypothetical protein [Yersinia intermedia]|uniref:hypothetical protein n=1 Tax=Yersinia intermedia TaxID=631 RepID=UPI0039C5FBEA